LLSPSSERSSLPSHLELETGDIGTTTIAITITDITITL
jgi:hypothetical protein